jgi:hypothetical protein
MLISFLDRELEGSLEDYLSVLKIEIIQNQIFLELEILRSIIS